MKTVFLRVLEADDKATALLHAVREPDRVLGRQRFEVDPGHFARIPGSPFAYWVSPELRVLFTNATSLRKLGYSVSQGLITADDARFLRLRWEVENASGWSLFAKGSTATGFMSECATAVRTQGAFADLIESANQKYPYLNGGAAKMLHATPALFGRPGLGYTRRTTSRFRTIAVPAAMCFSDKLPLISSTSGQDLDQLLSLLGITCSRPFSYLLELSLGAADAAARSYETGLVEAVPVPHQSPSHALSAIATLAHSAWVQRWRSLSSVDTSQAFVLPALLQVDPSTLERRTAAWCDRERAVAAKLTAIQAEIDELCFALYGIDEPDRRAITEGFGAGGSEEASRGGATDAEDDAGEDADQSESTADSKGLAAELVSWAVGVAFGRFDMRLATGARPIPTEPEPFDPLPAYAPGRLIGGDGLPLARPSAGYPLAFPEAGILVDDPGHAQDLPTAVHAVFDAIFGADADRWWHDVAAMLDPKGHELRGWLASGFFEHHLKRHSKSRRKAPILWQLGTPSGRYSVWLYSHRLTRDTFFQFQNQSDGIVAQKLAHEERQLMSLVQSAGANPPARERKEIATQHAFVDELRAMLEEVKRVAPLWNPKLDDGVIINFAPLWRLVPQHKPWQKELKSTWDALGEGKYDWAHLAMHLWPERVVPKCAKDRSLAIAHGVEEVFWVEGADGKWKPRTMPSRSVDQLVSERSSSAVKAALKSLVEAPSASGTGKKSKKGKTNA